MEDEPGGGVTAWRRDTCRVLLGKIEERTLGKPKRKWMDNIKVDPKELDW
jgi:hypothetical protein